MATEVPQDGCCRCGLVLAACTVVEQAIGVAEDLTHHDHLRRDRTHEAHVTRRAFAGAADEADDLGPLQRLPKIRHDRVEQRLLVHLLALRLGQRRESVGFGVGGERLALLSLLLEGHPALLHLVL
eukprot:6181808-Pleurochrysis_carterae.AAC.2